MRGWDEEGHEVLSISDAIYFVKKITSMCVGFWSFQAQPSPSNPHFKLILAANRDEVLSRPTARADFWRTKEHTILSGLDKAHIIASTGEEQGNGTWLGINPDTGRLSFLTNFREHPSTWLKESQSRGELVRDYLLHKDKHETTKNHIDCVVKSTSHLYNGFNLVSFGMSRGEGETKETGDH